MARDYLAVCSHLASVTKTNSRLAQSQSVKRSRNEACDMYGYRHPAHRGPSDKAAVKKHSGPGQRHVDMDHMRTTPKA